MCGNTINHTYVIIDNICASWIWLINSPRMVSAEAQTDVYQSMLSKLFNLFFPLYFDFKAQRGQLPMHLHIFAYLKEHVNLRQLLA